MTTKYVVAYSPIAKDDLKSIYLYIAIELNATKAARKQLKRIRNRIRSLESFPKRHIQVDFEPWASMKIHKLPVDNYGSRGTRNSEQTRSRSLLFVRRGTTRYKKWYASPGKRSLF